MQAKDDEQKEQSTETVVRKSVNNDEKLKKKGSELSEIVKVKSKWPVIVSGVALFSDGYCANSIGAVLTILKKLYPVEVSSSKALENVSSFAFLGTIVGQLTFGLITDYVGRKAGMLLATSLMLVFTIMCAGAYGPKGSIKGMLNALAAYRFLLGIGLGAEYPTSACAASEATSENMKQGKRHGAFAGATQCMINFGFLVGMLVPLIFTLIVKENHLTFVWRASIGFGAILPFSLLFARYKYKELTIYNVNSVKITNAPYRLALRKYWRRMLAIGLIWFIYDFGSYSLILYSSMIISSLNKNQSFVKTLAWSVLINAFKVPGSVIGAMILDKLSSKKTLLIGLCSQIIIGVIIAASYHELTKSIPAFSVLYGVYLAMGQFGAGNITQVYAAKSSATAIRGQFFSGAAALGKLGAFAGTFSLPSILKAFNNGQENSGLRGPFVITAILNVVALLTTLIFLPRLSQNCVEEENENFRNYLNENNYDVQIKFGKHKTDSISSDESL